MTLRLALVPLVLAACQPTPDDTPTPPTAARAVVISDTHVIASTYTCCENGPLDTTSIYASRDRLTYAIDQINDLQPPVGKVFILGDVFHQNYAYGANSVDDYLSQDSAARQARDLLARLDADVEIAWGNHDYEVPEIPAAFTHELFREVFATEPYHAVDFGGFRFLMMNSNLGETWNPGNEATFDPGTGSFGAEQLDWAADQLDDGVPTFLMFHHHPIAGTLAVHEREGAIGDVFDLVRSYSDVVQGVYMGHLHRWIDATGVAALAGQDLANVPFQIVGGLRYDGGNFLVMELDEAGGTFDVVNEPKAVWNTTWAYDETWSEDGDPIIDLSSDPAFDPATGGRDLDHPVDPENPPTP